MVYGAGSGSSRLVIHHAALLDRLKEPLFNLLFSLIVVTLDY